MKFYRYSIFLIVMVLATGCDFLGYNKNTHFSKQETFHNPTRTKDFLNNIYAHIPAGLNSVGSAMRASGADNAEESNTLADIQKINDGTWSAIRTVDAKWSDMYTGIRAANKFLANFKLSNYEDRQYNEDYQQLIQQFELYPYQARFLRSYFYFKLIKRYGDVPLITKALSQQEANTVQPSSYQKVTNFIVAECDSIIPQLPVSYESIPNNETGRITSGAVKALKARVLLYAASPLHNPSGDIAKWEKAATAANAIINSGTYTLISDYSDVVNNLSSDELIMGRRDGPSNFFERNNYPIGYEGANKNGTDPTQNLVDSYEMQNTGKPIDDPGSGYDPAHPYQGRDPRLEKTIIVNNSQWKDRKVQIFTTGKDGPPQTGATETGYYLKKYVREDVSLSPSNTSTLRHIWVIFDYAEVLLNYSEAMNEAYGPDDAAGMGMSARQAVNKIRERATMPDFPAGMSKSQFRKKLRNERRVELAFENQRFWDIRRWKIGPSTTDIEGVTITKQADGSFDYQTKTVENRVWNDKMYLYPIPQSEIYKNESLEQNEGW